MSFILSLALVDRRNRKGQQKFTTTTTGGGSNTAVAGSNDENQMIMHRRLIRWELVRAWEIRERLVLFGGLVIGLILGGVLVHSMRTV